MSDELKKFIEKKIEGDALSIVTLDGGGAIEMIDEAMQDAFFNATDLNRKLKVKRQVIFTMDIGVLDDNRSMVNITYDVKTKLANRIPISEGEIYDLEVDGSGKKGVYAKSRQRQNNMFENNVHEMKGGK